MVAKFFGRTETKHFVERVPNHRVAEAGRDIAYIRALLLRLLHAGVHKHCAAGTKIRRILREKRLMHEFRKCQIEAAGGAGLIQFNLLNHSVMRLQALHILTADIDHIGGLRVKECCRAQMRHGFHFAQRCTEHRGRQIGTIARGADTPDLSAFRHLLQQLNHMRKQCRQHGSRIAAVPGLHNAGLAVKHDRLHGGGTKVHPHPEIPFRFGNRSPGSHLAAVIRKELLIFLFTRKQRGKT